MKNTVNSIDLFGRKKYKIGDIVIRIPTIRMICGDDDGENAENKFWREAGLFINAPADMISELDDLGLDFEKITDYGLFLLQFMGLKSDGYTGCMLFDNFDLFDLNISGTDLVDSKGKVIIDENSYAAISDLICAILNHEKTKMPHFGNAYAKKKRIELDREKKAKAKKNKGNTASVLGSLKLRLVCSGKTPYSFDTVGNLTIYELLWSIKQIDKEKSVDELKQTALVGNDLTKIASEKLSPYAL